MKPILIIGNGGHAKVVKDIINAQGLFKVSGYLDDKIKERYNENDLIFDNLNNLHLYKRDYYFVIAIGNNNVREKIFNKVKLDINKFPVLIHPDTTIGDSVLLGNGTVVMPGAVINAHSEIGQHAIINTSSVIEHDCEISDYAHISPGAVLTGNVSVGEQTQIGANATVIPNIEIGSHVMVGAGSTVLCNIKSGTTVVGTPAKVIKEQ